ncbi:hypothetical protein [Nostoc sp. FACHB-110]|uniref:hypothetical protein n=1 Tax=Nostoc sp. FACHB-110 TaxID=2692834 RepID=UPI0016856CCB|nr:hypothetical protein [Nostoc sp. FACHB-110]MBD2440693.1 hypothetical protein [Nostoc sp. FACHB-110]
MTQVSQPKRTRILPESKLIPEDIHHHREQRDALAVRCRHIFERLRPNLIETYYNWHIAIEPETEQYIIDPTLLGITQKIREIYGITHEVKLTIFRLNETGTCGRL